MVGFLGMVVSHGVGKGRLEKKILSSFESAYEYPSRSFCGGYVSR